MINILAILVMLGSVSTDPLDRLAWLGGCWTSQGDGYTTVEMWMPPAGGLMLGASRTVVGGAARQWEHLRLTSDGDELVYTAVPSGQQETAFRSVSLDDDGFVVENLEHDFPQRITYRRSGASSLSASVEGPGPEGPRGFQLNFSRTDCGASLQEE